MLNPPAYIITNLPGLSMQGLTVDSSAVENTRQAAGWILFLSLVVFMYHIFATFQLFYYLKLLYVKVTVGKSLWYLFPLIVSAVKIIILSYIHACVQ